MGGPAGIGEVIAAKYRVSRIIGEGGMGVVVAADHLQLLQPVAIKFLHADAKPVMVERLAREARAAAQIQSEHVARIVDIDYLPTGEPYIVMELLEGEDLAQLLEQSGPLPPGDAVSYLLQACEAIGQAHELGIVHRDLKPANLFLTRSDDGSPCIKVLDFGISKLRDEEGSPSGGAPLTATDTVMGSPLYMSPEQWASAKNADARSDVWSLGAILYELLLGRPPFTGPGVAQICHAVLNAAPPSLAAQRPDLLEGLPAVVMACLHKEPDQRPASAADLARALSPYAPPQAAAHVGAATPANTNQAQAATAALAATLPTDGLGPQTPIARTTPGSPLVAPTAPEGLAATALAATEQAKPMQLSATAPAYPVQTAAVTLTGRAAFIAERPKNRPWLWLGLGLLGLVVLAGAIGAIAYF